VAPPDWHLLLKRGTVHLTHGPKENWTRPAINPLFRSAALQGPGPFAKMVITPNAVDGLSPEPARDPLDGDRRLVRNWRLSTFSALPNGKDPMYNEMSKVDGKRLLRGQVDSEPVSRQEQTSTRVCPSRTNE